MGRGGGSRNYFKIPRHLPASPSGIGRSERERLRLKKFEV
jgi:hypothetical protein